MISKLAIIPLVLGLASGCAHVGDKTTDMLSYEESRDSSDGERVQSTYPKAFEKAQKHYELALLAHNDRDKELAKHHSLMANIVWSTATAKLEVEDARRQEAEQREWENEYIEAKAKVDKRIAHASEAMERLERIAALEAKQGSFRTRETIAAAMLSIREAEAINAREYAGKEMAQADVAIEAATVALEGGNQAEATKQAKLAKIVASKAKTLAEPLYEKNKARLMAEAARRKIFEETQSIAGATSHMSAGGIILTLHKLFASGETNIESSRQGTLTQLAEIAKQHSQLALIIEGHTDNRGSNDKNRSLSQARADSIVSFLARLGIDPSRMTSSGKGSSSPIANNRSKDGRAENRRIEVTFVLASP